MMRINTLKLSLVILGCSVVFSVGTIAYLHIKKQASTVGSLLFRNSIDRTSDVKSIKISNFRRTVTLYVDNNIWKVKEAEGYYTNYISLGELFNTFNQSRFVQKTTAENEEENTITILDKDNNKLDEISILGNNKAKAQDGNIYTISPNIYLAEEVYSWLEQPLLNINDKDIERIEVENKYLKRDDYTTSFNQNIPPIHYLTFKGVSKELKNKGTPKHIKVTTFDGLVVDLNIYKVDNEFWAEQKISTTKLPTTDVNDYVNSHTMLYDGWYFKLGFEDGHSLFYSELR